MKRRVAVPLADGFEEIEAITVVDVLRRAGVEVRILGLAGRQVTGAHGIVVRADALLDEELDGRWDAVVLPGGMPGAATLRDDRRVQELIRRQRDEGGWVAAICAAPIALSEAGLLKGRQATGFPGFDLDCGAYIEDQAVVEDGRVLTSRGPGTALPFALQLVRRLVGDEAVRSLQEAMLVSLGASDQNMTPVVSP